MFRSLMTIIRELYLYLTKVMFWLKHSVHKYNFSYVQIKLPDDGHYRPKLVGAILLCILM